MMVVTRSSCMDPQSTEGSFAEVGQVVTGTKFGSYLLTPEMASKMTSIDYELG